MKKNELIATEKTLPLSFYQSEDVLTLAQSLLGKEIITNIDGNLTSGIIVETEAYGGVTDKASHAYNGRFTERTKTMYEAGGVAYVYLCYGIHSLLNVVTAHEGIPHAILIRAIEPRQGLETMLARRKMERLKPAITKGPGALSQALGVTRAQNGLPLNNPSIRIEQTDIVLQPSDIIATKRIGVDYAAEDALLPWRFYVKGNVYVSRPVKLPE